MDTCGLERVERFRINLNEKNFASQKNTLTSSLPQKMPSRWLRLAKTKSGYEINNLHRCRLTHVTWMKIALYGVWRRTTLPYRVFLTLSPPQIR